MLHRTVVLADLHVGSVHALWPPEEQVAGGGFYILNKGQQFLSECWKDATRRIRRLKPDLLVLAGDTSQGKDKRDGELVTNRTDIQERASIRLLEPIREKSRECVILKGTRWHEGKSSEDTASLGRELDAKLDKDEGGRSFWEALLQLPGGDKPVVSISHSISATKVSWYEATALVRDTLMMLSEFHRWHKNDTPNLRLYVRAHRHRCFGVYIAPDIQAWTAPAWQLRTAYAFQKSIVTLPHIGYLVIEWDGVDIVVKPRLYKIPLPYIEVLTFKGEGDRE